MLSGRLQNLGEAYGYGIGSRGFPAGDVLQEHDSEAVHVAALHELVVHGVLGRDVGEGVRDAGGCVGDPVGR